MHALIIGGNQTASYIAKILLAANCQVHVIEQRDEILEKLRHELPDHVLVVGECTDPDTMEQAGIQTADVVAAVTRHDELNLVASTIAKYEFGVPRVIALVNRPQNEWLFTQEMGVDIFVNQAYLLAHIMVDEIDLPSMVTLMMLNHGASTIVQFPVAKDSFAAGRPVKDLGIPEDSVLIAIHRDRSTIVTRGETVIQAGDRVLALTTESSQAAVGALFA